MELKTSIFKRQTGRHRGKWVLQVEYFDETENRNRVAARFFNKRLEAVDERPKLEAKLRKTHGQIQTGSKMTFSDLCGIAKARFYREAVIIQGRKIEGVRSHKTVHGQIDRLEEFFGKRKLTQITPHDLTKYKTWRFKQGSRRGKQDNKERVEIGHVTLNREMAVLRRMMKYAYGQGWVDRDIFQGSNAIDRGAEKPRGRTLSVAEEVLLLACCQGTRVVPYKWQRKGVKRDVEAKIDRHNPELRALILLAVDSAMRRSEILKLDWADIDFANRIIRVVGTNTKTQQERLTLLSKRTAEELKRLPGYGKTEKVFSVGDFKRSWNTAKRLASINALTFHDLRRSAITRWELLGTPHVVVQKLAGHAANDVTTRHYVAVDAEAVRMVADRVDRFNESGGSFSFTRVESTQDLETGFPSAENELLN